MATETSTAASIPQTVQEYDFDDLSEEDFTMEDRAKAGAFAGIVEHLALYPFDTAKTRVQTGTQVSLNKSIDYIKFYCKPHNWSGSGNNMMFVGLAHALQFPIIEYSCAKVKQKQDENNANVQKKICYVKSNCKSCEHKRRNEVVPKNHYTSSSPNPNSWSYVLVNNVNPSLVGGVLGALAHDLLMTPANVIKQRMQQCKNTTLSSAKFYHLPSVQCAYGVYQTEGFKAFYRSFPAQYLYSAVYLGSYYFFYNDLLKRKTSQHNLNIYLDFILRSVVATAIATIVSQPLDNIVTRVNTQYSTSQLSNTVASSHTSLPLKNSPPPGSCSTTCSPSNKMFCNTVHNQQANQKSATSKLATNIFNRSNKLYYKNFEQKHNITHSNSSNLKKTPAIKNLMMANATRSSHTVSGLNNPKNPSNNLNTVNSNTVSGSSNSRHLLNPEKEKSKQILNSKRNFSLSNSLKNTQGVSKITIWRATQETFTSREACFRGLYPRLICTVPSNLLTWGAYWVGLKNMNSFLEIFENVAR